MKQHITTKQLDELSEKGMDRLVEWCFDNREYAYNLSIGQMIEFLYDHRPDKRAKYVDLPEAFGTVEDYPRPEFMCDALWEAVKEVLND